MTMVTTEVINDTNDEYVLKQVIQGSYLTLKNLQGNGDTYSIECDPNGTYREFWVGTNRAGDETTISSDECAEVSRIIFRNSGAADKAEIRRIKRDGKRDWSEVINKTGHECNIFKESTNGTTSRSSFVEIGKLKKENGSRFFIFSDDPKASKPVFSKHKVVKAEVPTAAESKGSGIDNENMPVIGTAAESKGSGIVIENMPVIGTAAESKGSGTDIENMPVIDTGIDSKLCEANEQIEIVINKDNHSETKAPRKRLWNRLWNRVFK